VLIASGCINPGSLVDIPRERTHCYPKSGGTMACTFNAMKPCSNLEDGDYIALYHGYTTNYITGNFNDPIADVSFNSPYSLSVKNQPLLDEYKYVKISEVPYPSTCIGNDNLDIRLSGTFTIKEKSADVVVDPTPPDETETEVIIIDDNQETQNTDTTTDPVGDFVSGTEETQPVKTVFDVIMGLFQSLINSVIQLFSSV